MHWPALVLLLVTACGRLGFDPRPDEAHDGALADAPLVACTTWGPFAAPVHVPEVGSSSDDWAPRVTADGLLLVFYSARTGTLGSFDIFQATRVSTQATFSIPAALVEVSSPEFDAVPWISPDGLAIVVASQRAGGMGINDLWQATRSSRNAAFTTPALIPGVNSTANDNGPWLSADQLRLYLSSDRTGNSGDDLYVSARASTMASFGPPVLLGELNSPQNERGITLSADELEVFFSSNRNPQRDYEIYTATRASVAMPFSAPTLVAALNTPNDDVSSALSADATTLYLSYDTDTAGTLDAEIWTATRACLD